MEEKLQQLFVVTGPESSGKSTLSLALAQWFDTPLVREAARDYLQGRAPGYNASDLLQIAERQQQAEEAALDSGSAVVVADTDHQVLELWWRERFAASKGPYPVITKRRQGVQRQYLLCYPDLDWQPDPLRENPLDRERLFKLQMQRLEEIGASYRVIWGQGAFRFRLARGYILKSLKSTS